MTEANSPIIHPLTVNTLAGKPLQLSEFAGKVLLIVNTASECGFTPQYAALQALHDKYSAQGFAVLGFPSNDFGAQEPGSSEQIASFCTKNYGVTFPMFEKVHTKGASAAPLYVLLAQAYGAPKWNFHKYLVGKDGRPVEGWGSAVEPLSSEVQAAVERELGA